MNVAAVRSFLDAGDILTREFMGENPYHNVVCIVVYACSDTGRFLSQYEQKIKALDEQFDGVDILVPNCAPILANIVYMVQYLHRLNPKAEVLFGVDDIPCYEWASMMHFGLFVIATNYHDKIHWKYNRKALFDTPLLTQESTVRYTAVDTG